MQLKTITLAFLFALTASAAAVEKMGDGQEPPAGICGNTGFDDKDCNTWCVAHKYKSGSCHFYL
ncbi:hypothetical protein VTN96DRAFT_10288 [Rasamsonia emersonii]